MTYATHTVPVVWDCNTCEKENEQDVEVGGYYADVKCRFCGQEKEVEVG
jgi:transcription elongation factor Elf1